MKNVGKPQGQVRFLVPWEVNLSIPLGFSSVIRPWFDSRGRLEAFAR